MIRKPELSDFSELNELTKLSWIEGFSEVLSPEDISIAREMESFTDKKSLKQDLKSENVTSLVYEKSGKVVGKAKLAHGEDSTHDIANVEENEVQLRSFYIHPDHWNQGLGTKLLERIIDEAPSWAELMKVETLEGSGAVEFYRKNGFEVIGSGTFSAEDVDIVENDYPTLIMEKNM